MQRLNKYKIGLAIIGVFSVVLVGLVVIRASDTKQDNATYTKTADIANKLSDYITNNNAVPVSLTAAGVTAVPSTISYQRVSDTSYKFCADYKATSTDFQATSVVTDLLSGSLDSSGDDSSAGAGSDSGYGYLNVTTAHKKGENCQTVDVSGYIVSPEQEPSTSTDPYAACDSIVDNQAWQQCIDKVNQTPTDSTSGTAPALTN